MKIVLITVLLIVPSSYCYVISGGEDTTSEPIPREKDPEDMNQILKDLSKAVFGDDTELIKEIAEEVDEEMSDSSKEVLQSMNKNFLESLLRLHQGGELYKDARKEAILTALHSAFKETSGDVDQSFITDLRRKLQQKEQQRRQKIKEFETNGLKTQANDASLKDK